MVRVRLRFDSTPVHYARQCWFLFDPDSCRLVGDVAYLIAKRFNLQDAHGIQVKITTMLVSFPMRKMVWERDYYNIRSTSVSY